MALPRWDLPARALAALHWCVAIGAAAGALGSSLSGLLAPFPIVTGVLAVFTYAHGGRAQLRVLLRNFLIGFYGFAAFCFVLAIGLDSLGGQRRSPPRWPRRSRCKRRSSRCVRGGCARSRRRDRQRSIRRLRAVPSTGDGNRALAADDRPSRHGRLLRVGRAAAAAGAEGEAGGRLRLGAAGGGDDGELRGAEAGRDPLGDAGGGGAAAAAGRGLPEARLPRLPGGLGAGDGGAAAQRRDGRGGRARRGLPGPDRDLLAEGDDAADRGGDPRARPG